jgi:RNA polymerase sigma-70 factor (ECF subfamily)
MFKAHLLGDDARSGSTPAHNQEVVLDEAALIREAQRGNLEAFNRLVLKYQNRVYDTAYWLMAEPEDAADATQEAFISAFKSIRRFRGGSFRAWLLRIVTNACYDEMRRRKRRPTTPLEDLEIRACLARLPDKYREVMVLADVEGFKYQEVAQIIGIPLGTVKSRLARARGKMQAHLQCYQDLLPTQFRQNNHQL